MLALYLLVSILCLLVFIFWRMSGYFQRRGIKTAPCPIPIIGNLLNTLLLKQHFKDVLVDVYNSHPQEKYVGMFLLSKPVVVLRDLDMIKLITIKDFDSFVDRGSTVNENADLIFGNGMFALKGQKWRDMRATLSPAFSSAKIKRMYEFVEECADQMTKYFLENANCPHNKERGYLLVDAKEAFARYTNDVIATCAFGLKVNSFAEKDNDFFLKAKETVDISGKKYFKYILMMILPKLAKLFKINIVNATLGNFYRSLVWDTIKYREESKYERPDLIHLLMKAKKGELKHDIQEDNKDAGFSAVQESSIGRRVVKRDWSDDDIVAQALTFFAAGFETSSTLLSLIMLELSMNQKIQKRLQEEIDSVDLNERDRPSYETLNQLKYMDMIVSEAMRKWPTALIGDRMCTKPYDLPPPNDKHTKTIRLNTGHCIWIPIYALHHDPNYFEDPEVFDPERFNEENKKLIKPFTYLPFGVGPRNCIGSRFALMEMKIIIFNVLRNFDIVPTDETQYPIKVEIASLSYKPEKGFWVGMKPREME